MLSARRQSGTTMLEILVTLVILAFGLLGLAGLNAKIQTLDMEAYQRAQAILLLQDISSRIRANSANAASYVTGTCAAGANCEYGTEHDDATACAGTTQADLDICQISSALKGAAESSSGTKLGAMIGARACVEQLVAPNPTPAVCTPGSYRVTVTWTGLGATSASSLTCAQSATEYQNKQAYRRAIASTIVVGLPSCI